MGVWELERSKQLPKYPCFLGFFGVSHTESDYLAVIINVREGGTQKGDFLRILFILFVVPQTCAMES